MCWFRKYFFAALKVPTFPGLFGSCEIVGFSSISHALFWRSASPSVSGLWFKRSSTPRKPKNDKIRSIYSTGKILQLSCVWPALEVADETTKHSMYGKGLYRWQYVSFHSLLDPPPTLLCDLLFIRIRITDFPAFIKAQLHWDMSSRGLTALWQRATAIRPAEYSHMEYYLDLYERLFAFHSIFSHLVRHPCMQPTLIISKLHIISLITRREDYFSSFMPCWSAFIWDIGQQRYREQLIHI